MALSTVHDVTQILAGRAQLRAQSVRVLDHYAATTIASYACIRMSDTNGNPSDAYWKCFKVDPAKQCGLLMNVATVEKVMLELMNKMIEKHEEALLQINDDVAVCKWLMKFKDKWEDEYRKRMAQHQVYDISEPVLAVMHEAVLKTERVFETHAPSLASTSVRKWLQHWYSDDGFVADDSLPIHQAVTRFYFRHAQLAQYMCMIAGKIWKLQEVCDKPGAFPSTKQQNLLQKQLQDSVTALVQALNSGSWSLPHRDHARVYCIDHKTEKRVELED